jgi:PPOX class probable F420-dependent enzyme
MSNPKLRSFEQQAYLNLKTFRKTGAGVPTPVWFAEDQGVLYVRTIDGSGKVKRIRNNGSVQVAPCDARGGLLGEWLEGQARLVTDQATIDEVDRLLDKKYGFQRKMFNLMGSMRKEKGATIAIEIS